MVHSVLVAHTGNYKGAISFVLMVNSLLFFRNRTENGKSCRSDKASNLVGIQRAKAVVKQVLQLYLITRHNGRRFI
ncbi:hypothetical protein L218DRAFT_672694 [Marasmius fiardii PR-910]|nr:hypothetical protein L218DRAFT_672694 [Marasmius fiardii PR-910]